MSAASELQLDAAELSGLWRADGGWRRFVRDPFAMTGLVVVVFLVVLAFVLPPLLDDPNALDPSAPLSGPTASHILGTDPFGRDLLARVAAGLATSLEIAFLSVTGAAVAGVFLGLVAGWFGGALDIVIMRVIDAVLAFPVLLLALFVVAALGPGATHLAISIGFVFVPYFVRLMRTQTLALRSAEFVVAGEAYGTAPARLLAGIVLPNALTPILVQYSLSMGFAILAEAGLSFLGLGIQPPDAALGLMLQDAQEYLEQSLWYSVVPGLAIIVAVLGFNMLGDGIRDAFDPGVSAVSGQPDAVLAVDGLTVETRDGSRILDGVSLELGRRRAIGIVGESGCGKSTLALAIMGLLPPALTVRGSVRFDGSELVGLSHRRLRAFRGSRIAMIFQNPFASLNPSMRVGDQIGETLEVHRGLGRRSARARAVELLEQVEIPRAGERARDYPHEFSGGMQQRAMIAMAIACEPELLIADEPTTALDVTVQSQILGLLQRLAEERSMSLIVVSHDLAVVAQLADAIAVMYAGQLVEQAPANAVFRSAQHPYTRALLASVPRLDDRTRGPLPTIPGSVESGRCSAACRFNPRCGYAQDVCRERRPPLEPVPEAPGEAACWVLPWKAS